MKYVLDGRCLNIEISSLFNKTVQDFLDAYIPSKKYQHLLIQNKWLLIDNKPCKREDELKGDILSINIYPEDNIYKKVKNTVDIAYEDELCVVVFKPKGVLVHSDGNDEITLTDYVKSYYKDTPYVDIQPIHRLDKETSGLVMFSKSIIFQPLFDKLLSEKTIRRYYLAFVKGKMRVDESITIDKPIGKDRHNSNKRVIAKNGQNALTKVKCIGSKNGISVLRCYLDTGRTHQIRVHLASIGYPIINDDLYGIRNKALVRMGLVADELEFFHPLKEETIKVECILPNDVSKLLNEVLD